MGSPFAYCNLRSLPLRETTSPMRIISALTLSKRPAIAFVIVGLFWGCFAAYVPETKARLGVSDAVFGMLLLANAVGLVSSMWIAPKIDRLLGARGMQVAGLLFAIAFIAPGFANTPVLFAISMALVGAASGLTDVLMNARVSELEERHKRPLMNANHAMFSVAYAVAAIATGVMREMGIPPSQAFLGLVVIIATLSLFTYMEIEAPAEPDANQGGYPLWPIVVCGTIVLLAFMTEATVETWSAIHIERTLMGRAAEGALGPAMLGITMAVGRFSGQAMSDRFSDTNVIFAATCITATGAVMAALAPSPFWAYIGFGVLGLGVSVIGPIGLALVGRAVPKHLRTEAISRAAVMGFSGFFIAPALMGMVSEVAGLRVAFGVVALFALCLLPLTMIARRY